MDSRLRKTAVLVSLASILLVSVVVIYMNTLSQNSRNQIHGNTPDTQSQGGNGEDAQGGQTENGLGTGKRAARGHFDKGPS